MSDRIHVCIPNPFYDLSEEGSSGDMFQPTDRFRERRRPSYHGSTFEGEPYEGLDLSFKGSSILVTDIKMYPTENRMRPLPPRRKKVRKVFSGLPVTPGGSTFQGYSGTAAGPVSITAPSISYRSSRSTESVFDHFSPTAVWQYMNLPHTITSDTANKETGESQSQFYGESSLGQHSNMDQDPNKMEKQVRHKRKKSKHVYDQIDQAHSSHHRSYKIKPIEEPSVEHKKKILKHVYQQKIDVAHYSYQHSSKDQSVEGTSVQYKKKVAANMYDQRYEAHATYEHSYKTEPIEEPYVRYKTNIPRNTFDPPASVKQSYKAKLIEEPSVQHKKKVPGNMYNQKDVPHSSYQHSHNTNRIKEPSPQYKKKIPRNEYDKKDVTHNQRYETHSSHQHSYKVNPTQESSAQYKKKVCRHSRNHRRETHSSLQHSYKVKPIEEPSTQHKRKIPRDRYKQRDETHSSHQHSYKTEPTEEPKTQHKRKIPRDRYNKRDGKDSSHQHFYKSEPTEEPSVQHKRKIPRDWYGQKDETHSSHQHSYMTEPTEESSAQHKTKIPRDQYNQRDETRSSHEHSFKTEPTEEPSVQYEKKVSRNVHDQSEAHSSHQHTKKVHRNVYEADSSHQDSYNIEPIEELSLKHSHKESVLPSTSLRPQIKAKRSICYDPTKTHLDSNTTKQVPKKRKSVSWCDQPHRSGTTNKSDEPVLPDISGPKEFDWQVEPNYFLGQARPVLAPVQAYSLQEETRGFCRDATSNGSMAIEKKRDMSSRNKEYFNADVPIAEYATNDKQGDDVVSKCVQNGNVKVTGKPDVHGCFTEQRNGEKVTDHLNYSVANTLEASTTTNKSYLGENSVEQKTTFLKGLQISIKGRNIDEHVSRHLRRIQGSSDRAGTSYNLDALSLDKNTSKNEKYYINSSFQKDKKTDDQYLNKDETKSDKCFIENQVEPFKKPWPKKAVRVKKSKLPVDDDIPLLPKDAVLPRAVWSIFKNNGSTTSAVPTNQQEEDGSSTDTASELDSSLSDLDSSTEEMPILEPVENVIEETVENKLVVTLENSVVKKKTRIYIFEKSTVLENHPVAPEKNQDFRYDEPAFRKNKPVLWNDNPIFLENEPVLNGDKPVFNGCNSIFKGDEPVLRDDKPCFKNDAAVFKDNKSVFDNNDSNDRKFSVDNRVPVIVKSTTISINSVTGKNSSENHSNMCTLVSKQPNIHEDINGCCKVKVTDSREYSTTDEGQSIIENNEVSDKCQKEEPVVVQNHPTTEGQGFTRSKSPLEPLWLLHILAHDPQVHDYITGTPFTNNGEDGGSSYEYYRLTEFQLAHLRVIPDDRLWKAYILDEVMLEIAGVPEAMPERKEELEAFSRELIIEALRRDYNVQNVETLRLCVINYLKKYPELRLPLLVRLVKDREKRE